MATNQPKGQSKVQGEGDYVSGRKFQEAEHKYAKEGPVEQAGREAAEALDGPEAQDLEDARRASAKGQSVPARHVVHREHRLDDALDDSFPASDPVPASPGSN